MIKFLTREKHLAIFQYIEYQRLKAKGDTVYIYEMSIVTDCKETTGSNYAGLKEFIEYKHRMDLYDKDGKELENINLVVTRIPLSILFEMIVTDWGVVKDCLQHLNDNVKEMGIDDITKLEPWGMSEDEVRRERKLQTDYKTSGTIWKDV